MSGDPKDGGGGERTNIQPGAGEGAGKDAFDDWFKGGEASPPPPPPRQPPPAPVDWTDANRGQAAPPPQDAWPEPTRYAPPREPRPPPTHAPGRGGGGQIAIGSLLNGIYEVKRFIARGGMGEVYEGVNVNTEERVAIKVILQHLAADPNVRQMFLREAQTLTKLGHPALVAYRLAAQEPTLGVFYIVTEFVDGKSLADLLGTIKPTDVELIALTKRLAEGLRAAHDFKVYHRDMSPDNVLCVGGRLSEAKVIDFGIAKDAGTSHATIVGDGFAGKLNYVAPEQFGDYGREIGPWTDVYSLALVILALANGKAVPMGATLVEAIDRRRAKPDVTVAPARLQPVLGKMLEPNPKDRYASMGEVIEALDNLSHGARRAEDQPGAPPEQRKAPRPKTPSGPSPLLLIAGGVGALAVLAGVGFLASQALKPSPEEAAAAANAAGIQAAAVVERTLPTIACSWLEASNLQEADGRVSMTLTGASSEPAAAEKTIRDALNAAKVGSVTTDTTGVARVPASACAALDAFRAVRAPEGGRRWVTPQAQEFHFQPVAACGDDPKLAAAVIEVEKPTAPGEELIVLGMEENGALQILFAGEEGLRRIQGQAPDLFVDQGRTLQIITCQDKALAASLVAVRGRGPFPLDLPDVGKEQYVGRVVDAGWRSRFEAMARQQGWKAQMAWYRVVEN